MDFSGIITALATPFLKGELDKGGFLNLMRRQVQAGVRQFVLAGTTGESPTLEIKELEMLSRWFKDFEKESGLPLKLIISAGTNSTKTTLEKIKRAADLGAQAVLISAPYYNRPPQQGLIAHFEAAAKTGSAPVILYNVPSRTACSISADTAAHLSQIENIIGIKEASGDMELLKELKRSCAEGFALLSGDDLTCDEFFNLGGHGAISAAANVLAKELIELFNSPSDKRRKLFEGYKHFLQELYKESNPIGVKQILQEQGLISSAELRLPLTAVKNPKLSKALAALK